MPTFLQLCEQLREEVGVQGTTSTTANQTGMHLRLINYIIKADKKIQRRKTNWKFLWNEWSQSITAETGSEINPPAGLGMFDETSFWLDAGTDDAVQLQYVDHKEWRDFYRHQFSETDPPAYVAIKPNGKLAILPAPDAAYTLTADYWRTPVPLVSQNQVSLIPEQFHDIIVAQAKIYFAERAHDTGLYQSAYVEHEDAYRELKAHQLPGAEDDNKSQSSISHVIEIL